MPNTVLVTGGVGPVGRLIVGTLRDRGTRVITYDPFPHAGDDAFQGDPNDLERLAKVLRDSGSNRVVHAATAALPQASWMAPPADEDGGDLPGAIAVMEASRLAGRIERVVTFSPPPDEDREVYDADAGQPSAVEQMGDVYRDRGLSVISLRVPAIYGPGIRLPTPLLAMIRDAIAGRAVETDAMRLVHARHVTEAVVDVLDRAGDDAVFEIAGGGAQNVEELASLVSRALRTSALGHSHDRGSKLV
jgi:nucleoside-diphosphate-sugar epimerase